MDSIWILFSLDYALPAFFLIVEFRYIPAGRPLLTPGLVVDFFFTLPWLLLFGYVAGAMYAIIFRLYKQYVPYLNLGILDEQPVWLQVTGFLLANDLTFYWGHRLVHEIRVFWFFHSVHHSGSRLNPFMQHRGHPLDEFIQGSIQVFQMGFFGGTGPGWFWYGLVNFFWGYFVHSDIRTNLGPLKYIMTTPQFHRIHHSLEREHWNKNYGGRFIFWDYLFGTMHPNFDEYPAVGLDDYPIRETSFAPWNIAWYWLAHLWHPFAMLWKYFTAKPPEVQA